MSREEVGILIETILKHIQMGKDFGYVFDDTILLRQLNDLLGSLE